MTVHRRVLADAEQALGVLPWVPADAIVRVINDHLALGAAVLVADGPRWRLSYESGAVTSPAAFALAQLAVQDGGFARLKRCDRCLRPFVDRTAARTGKRCADHRRPR